VTVVPSTRNSIFAGWMAAEMGLGDVGLGFNAPLLQDDVGTVRTTFLSRRG
jgi:hypothetical protein